MTIDAEQAALLRIRRATEQGLATALAPLSAEAVVRVAVERALDGTGELPVWGWQQHRHGNPDELWVEIGSHQGRVLSVGADGFYESSLDADRIVFVMYEDEISREDIVTSSKAELYTAVNRWATAAGFFPAGRS